MRHHRVAACRLGKDTDALTCNSTNENHQASMCGTASYWLTTVETTRIDAIKGRVKAARSGWVS